MQNQVIIWAFAVPLKGGSCVATRREFGWMIGNRGMNVHGYRWVTATLVVTSPRDDLLATGKVNPSATHRVRALGRVVPLRGK